MAIYGLGTVTIILLMFFAEFALMTKSRLLLRASRSSLRTSLAAGIILVDIASTLLLFAVILPGVVVVTDYLIISASGRVGVLRPVQAHFDKESEEKIGGIENYIFKQERGGLYRDKYPYSDNIAPVLPLTTGLTEQHIDAIFVYHPTYQYTRPDGSTFTRRIDRLPQVPYDPFATYIDLLKLTIYSIGEELNTGLSWYATSALMGAYVGVYQFRCDADTRGAVFKAIELARIMDDELYRNVIDLTWCRPGLYISVHRLPLSTMLVGALSTDIWAVCTFVSLLSMRAFILHNLTMRRILRNLQDNRASVLLYGIWLPLGLFMATPVIGLVFFL